MNSLQGNIASIQSQGELLLIEIQLANTVLRSLILKGQKQNTYLKIGTEIKALFKEIEVSLSAQNNDMLSFQNQIAVTVEDFEGDELLTRIILKSENGNIASIISTAAFKRLEIKKAMALTALVKMNEIVLAPC